jgi:hypothetical protein
MWTWNTVVSTTQVKSYSQLFAKLCWCEIARLRFSSSIETERFRQAKYLNWCQVRIPDPCGTEHGYKRIVACFGEILILDCHSQSATIAGYALAINMLFKLRKYPIPADLLDKGNMMSQIIHAHEREKNIAWHCSPLTKEMYVEMADWAKASPQDSVDAVLVDFFNLIRVGGFRVAECAQKTQTKVDVFEFALGNKVIKAFISSIWSFYDANGRLLTLPSLDGLNKARKKLTITFRIQKNWKNGQKITFAADDKHPHICPVCSEYLIFLWATWLGETDHQPIGVYLDHQGIVKYQTGNKIAELLQSIANHCHQDLTKDKISCFFLHSGRVWAVVLLDDAGINPDFIKSWLWLMEDSYRLYLRDTAIL